MPEESDQIPWDEIREHLFSGHRIEAIKAYREASGQDLKTSKEFVDELEKRLRAEFPDHFKAGSPKGCLGMLLLVIGLSLLLALSLYAVTAAQAQEAPKAFIDGTGPGWRALTEQDFVDVNGEPETWTWKEGLLFSTGQPIGVLRSRETFKNFEMVIQWRHLRAAGNSGVFVWVPIEALETLKPGDLPRYGIEVQMLDHGYTEQYETRTGKKGDWFTTNGDIFAVGESKLTPFAPTSPNGARSFPRKRLSNGVGVWNHYYVRAINGEIRLWVNGEEVSGGNGAEPAIGHLCMEAEGSPIEFKDFRIRELP